MKFSWYVFLGSLTLLVSFFYASAAPQSEQRWKGAVYSPNAAEAQPPQQGHIGLHKRAINSTANVTTMQTHLDEVIILASTQTPNMSDHEPPNQQFNANLQICSGKMAILKTLLNELYPEQMTDDAIVESDAKANFSSNLVAYETALYEFVYLEQLTSPFGPADCFEKYQQILESHFRETENDLIDNTKDEWKRALFRKTVIDLRRAMNELYNNCQSRGSLLTQGSAAADSVPGRNARASGGDFEVKDDSEDMNDRHTNDGFGRNVQQAGNA